ncbi:hypothetical protein [Phyllobacterium salinisoli]|uniref:hypothetical protein n=1 Tax=Phyllobacterium salinisoli TaxID=1899321 RepID=UPI0011C073D2|nr:hypothetical protein [Phyllobacterium salinisoli]
MKNYLAMAGISAIVLSSMIGLANSQEPAKNPPKVGENDSSNLCNNVAGGTAFGGYVASVLPGFSNDPNVFAINFTDDASKSVSGPIFSSLTLDTAAGSALYTGLLASLVSGMHSYIYCDGNGKIFTMIVNR